MPRRRGDGRMTWSKMIPRFRSGGPSGARVSEEDSPDDDATSDNRTIDDTVSDNRTTNDDTASDNRTADDGAAPDDNRLSDPDFPVGAPEAPAAVAPEDAIGPRDAPAEENLDALSGDSDAAPSPEGDNAGAPKALATVDEGKAALDNILFTAQMLEISLTKWLVAIVRGKLYGDSEGEFKRPVKIQPALYWGCATVVEVDDRAALLAVALAACGQVWMPGAMRKLQHPAALLARAFGQVFLPW